jgi:hypothetical protein
MFAITREVQSQGRRVAPQIHIRLEPLRNDKGVIGKMVQIRDMADGAVVGMLGADTVYDQGATQLYRRLMHGDSVEFALTEVGRGNDCIRH